MRIVTFLCSGGHQQIVVEHKYVPIPETFHKKSERNKGSK